MCTGFASNLPKALKHVDAFYQLKSDLEKIVHILAEIDKNKIYTRPNIGSVSHQKMWMCLYSELILPS